MKTRAEESEKGFNRRRTFCVSLLLKTEDILVHRVVSNSRQYWRTIGPLFLENAFHTETIILNNNKKTTVTLLVLAGIKFYEFRKFWSILRNLVLIENISKLSIRKIHKI